MSDFAVKTTCRECPWKKSATLGKFPPERYAALAETANRSGTFPQPIFACHMSREGNDRACAGFIIIVGYDNIGVRLAARFERFSMEEIKSDGELYESFDAMAAANGWEP